MAMRGCPETPSCPSEHYVGDRSLLAPAHRTPRPARGSLSLGKAALCSTSPLPPTPRPSRPPGRRASNLSQTPLTRLTNTNPHKPSAVPGTRLLPGRRGAVGAEPREAGLRRTPSNELQPARLLFRNTSKMKSFSHTEATAGLPARGPHEQEGGPGSRKPDLRLKRFSVFKGIKPHFELKPQRQVGGMKGYTSHSQVQKGDRGFVRGVHSEDMMEC